MLDPNHYCGSSESLIFRGGFPLKDLGINFFDFVLIRGLHFVCVLLVELGFNLLCYLFRLIGELFFCMCSLMDLH